MRPGWGKPIHQLMADNHVTIFFHGHDHLFVRQNLDGVTYQLVPQPCIREYRVGDHAAEYGYVNGDVVGNSGHLRVKVDGGKVTVDYVRSYLPDDESNDEKNGDVAFSYSIGD
jgi:hypothetical protein